MNKLMSKQKISITVPPALVLWMDNEIKKKTFGSRSHAVEASLAKMKKDLAPLPKEVKTEVLRLTNADLRSMIVIKEDATYLVSGELLLMLVNKQLGAS